MTTFVTFDDLPVEIKQDIRRIQAKASGERTTAEAAVLANYAVQIANEVIERNTAGDIVRAQGTSLPTGLSGFAKSATFVKSDVAAGTQAQYENTGDTTSAVWNLIGAINSTDIADGAVTPAKLNLVETGDDAYEGASSHQTLAPDLEIAAGAGGEDNDPSFLAAVMGNAIGDALTKTGNYIAGVIGALSVTGVNASKYPVAALMGVLMDGVTDADAIICAVLDGSDPSAATNARAAFGVRMINNNASSGVEYGLDLHDAGDTDIMTSADPFRTTKATVRSASEVCIIDGAGVPVDYTDGDPVATGEGYAEIGSLYIDRTNGKLYINGGTKAQPVWKIVTSA